MKSTASALLAALVLAACAQHLAPASAPTPEVLPPVAVAHPVVPPPAAPVDSPALAKADSVAVSDSDVVASASRVFGDSAVDAAPTWDIDVHSYETRDRVQHYISVFSGTAKSRLEQQLEDGTRFEAMIRATFHAESLPEDMYYLGLIESGYNPNAYSKAAAVGMWQFMTGTARGMGLRVDWWIDERRDPVKSTQAAARFLKDLRGQFGSLYLAAAAYDGGPGRVSRGLARYADDLQNTAGDDLFFELADRDYFRNETREYVPQLIAAALVGKDPARYGLTITPEPAFVYDSVRVGPSTPLAAIAAASSTAVGTLQGLNPQILRGMTPPGDSVDVRIPLGAAPTFAQALAALPKADREAVHGVESKSGEYASTIAKKYGVTTTQLDAFNPKLRHYTSGHLVPGQHVLVPSRAVALAARAVPNPDIELYGVANGRHVVRSGETLSGLAVKFHTTVRHLMTLNHLQQDTIFLGQTLAVTGSAPRRATASKAKKTGKSGSH